MAIAIRTASRLCATVILASLSGCEFSESFSGPAEAPLREYAETLGIGIGTAVSHDVLTSDLAYRQVLVREFNQITPENSMKWEFVHPGRDQWRFDPVDRLVEFASANKMRVRGHTLVWHKQLPAWVPEIANPSELRTILREHISVVVGRYEGRVFAWDVINEGIADDGNGLKSTLFLERLGADYIDDAFRTAHAADPGALLFFNDYEIAELGPKSDALFALVSELLARDVPIHGVGMQLHVNAAYPKNLQSFAENVRRFEALGLYVDITELDVRIRDLKMTARDARQRQARTYYDLATVRLALPGLTSISLWGFSDAYSWIDQFYGEDDPLLFTEELVPKPAYYGLQRALANATLRRTPNKASATETKPDTARYNAPRGKYIEY
jgi:endo-1,4-beta-xylanase